MHLFRRTPLAAAVLAGVLACGCSGGTPGPQGPAPDSGAVRKAAPPAVAAPPAKVTKLLVFVEENHSLAQMTGGMPYTFRLAEKYGYAADYAAITHPSLPNYIAIAGGKTYGVHDDAAPAANPVPGRSVFGQALAHHRSVAVYAQSMPGRCVAASSGAYAVKHNPWPYFTHERRGCLAHDVPMRRFGPAVATGSLPQVGMVIPDLQHDAHNGTLQQADAWFHAQMSRVFAGPDWKSGHLAVVLTADEDDGGRGNRVLTVVIHPSQHHRVVMGRLSHYSLTRLYEDVADLPYLNGARTAPSMAKAFHLPVG